VEKADENWLYQLGTAPVRLYRWLFTSPRTGTIQDPYPDGAVLDGPEIRAALSGRYGARTRITPGEEASVTLYSAIPIYNGGEEPIGAVLVNQSTYRILVDLYELRLDVFRLSLLSLLAALVITIYLELSVARPLIRLTSQSRIWGGSRGPLQNFPPPLNRKDEIGQLSIALHQMAGELRERMKRMESFSSDVAHELKNPLASMAAASEIGLDLVKSPEGQKLFSRIETDVQRLRRLVDDIRDISRIDGLDKQEIEGHGTLASTLPQLLKEGWREVEDLSWILPKEDQTFPVRPGLMQRILVNLVDNADSLRPRGSTIIVEVFEDREFYGLRVSDQGPGFPAEILPRVFERFYSYRPEKGSRHSGLGLSLVQTIVQWTGGTCLAENYPIGSSQPMGARVSLTWPKVP
jgi:two-component system sensor histidine kinase ChvG